MIQKKLTVPNEILFGQVCRLIGEGKDVTILARGNSMLPFIKGDQDSVILSGFQDLNIGDIALAEIRPGHFVLHRILSVGEEVILMGDGNLKGMERCRKDDIRAVATTIVRNGKHINCCSKKNKCLAWIWKKLLPFRRILLGVYRRIFL